MRTNGLLSRGEKLTIPQIDGLRGVALLAVIFGHGFAYILGNMHLNKFGISLTPLVRSGWHGVNLFFVLSAFVLYLPYAIGDREIRTLGSCWQFYRNRALRLLPAYYVIVLAQMSFSHYRPFGSGLFTRETLGILSFTFSFMPDVWVPFSVNGSLWSLGTEVLFSAVFPLLCWLCLRFGTVRILLVSIPIAIAFRLWGFYLTTRLVPVNWMEAMMVGRIDEFLWGFLLAETFARGRIPRHPYLLWFSGLVILVPVLTAYSHIAEGRLPRVFLTPLVTVLDVGIVLLVAAALAGRSWWSGFLTMRWLRVVGKACYSLYLWHYPLMVAVHRPTEPWKPLNFAAFILFLCILSGITYRFVEFRKVEDWRSLFLIPKRLA
jgi:peptidoglycan/LPS O-acetylase OafA/YrhL